jgi:hypothetical protein
LAIRIILKDRLTPVAAIQDVINRAGILDSQLAGHDRRVVCATSCINTKNRHSGRFLIMHHWRIFSGDTAFTES